MRSFFLSEPRLLLFGFFISYFASYGQTFFISIFNLEIRSLLNLSDGQFGLVYSLATLISAFILVWFGKLIDKIDLRIYTFIISLGLSFGCIGMFFLTKNLLILFLIILSLRFFGQGAMTHTSITTMSRYYDTNRGKAISVSEFGGMFGFITFPLIAVLLIKIFTWKLTWLFAGISILIIFIPAYFYLLKDQGSRNKEFLDKTDILSLERNWLRRDVIVDKKFYVYLPIFLVPPFVITGLVFHQVFIITNKGWNMELLASSFIGLGVFSMVGLLLGGPFIDKMNTRKVIPFHLFPMLIGILIMMFFDHYIFIFPYMALLGLSMGLGAPFTGSLWAELYGVRNLGAIRALLHACMVFASSLSPFLMGIIIDYNFGYFSIGLFCIILIVCASYLPFMFRNK